MQQKRRRNYPEEWESFEDEVYAYVDSVLRRGDFGFIPKRFRLRRRAKYHARDSGALVNFEIALEVFERGNKRPAMVWIWECKHYPNRKVPVKDVRKLAHELRELEVATRGIMVTPVGYQKSTIAVANAHNIAVWTLRKKVHYREGLHGPDRPIDYVELLASGPGLRKPTPLYVLLHTKCLNERPPRKVKPRRYLLELG